MNAESYRFKLGKFECIVINDGIFAYPYPAATFFVNAPKDRLAVALREHNFDPENWEEHISQYLCLLVDTGERLVLVDTGAGGLEATTGKLLPGLKAEGIAPEDIDTVILTHGHPDHVGGGIDEEGKPAFPDARYVMWQAEWDFWTLQPDLSKMPANEHLKQLLVALAQKSLPPIRDQLDFIDREMEIVPGIRAIPAFGHTPGHIVVTVSSGGEKLLCISDLAILPITLEHPDWYAAVDFDSGRVVASRRKFFSRAANEKALVFAFHFPFPGLGHVVQKGEAWKWQPIKVAN